MYASNLGSTNNSDEVQVSTILPQNIPTTSTDNTPLVSSAHGAATSNILRKMSGIFRVPTRQTESGYVEFGRLENQHIASSINSQYTESIVDGNSSQKKTLGTFNGVFSPVALSMFSALVFIRVGYIVGNAGLLVTLLQFGIAYGILIFTVASVCAISTNGAVEGGGAYFMISRTLGPEFGGSIGTLFFLANVVSSALCISGCMEGLVDNFGPSGYLIKDGSEGFLQNTVWYRLLYCTALNGISLALCVIGATMFAKTSVLILAIVTLSLGSVIVSFFIMDPQEIPVPNANTLIQNATHHVTVLYTGLNKTTFKDNIYPEYGRDYTSLHGDQIHFAAVFGVLFSGVTGIMAGANMSGELKNPGRSIPVGTLSAVAFTLVIYLSLAVLTAATCTRELLQNNYMYMMPINIWSPFVAIGVLTATFSAALSNLIGGSRVLLALAKDKVFGSFLNFISKGTFRGNPIVAVIVSWALVQLMLFIGSLNLIAQINSVLFLLSYLATNLACVGLQLTSAPNFRPTYTYFSVHTATFGLLGTIAMMFVISPAYAGLSIAACITLVAGLHLFASTDRGDKDAPYWGSISQALIFHQVRKYLLMLDSRKNHVKYWRPQILLLVSSPRSCCPLIDFVNDIKKSGLFVLGHVFVPKNGNEPENVLDVTMDPSNKEYPLWLELIDFLKVKAFVELTTASTIREGFQHLVRISGMGAMKPNTIVLGFYDNKKPIDFFNSESSYKTGMFDSEVFNGSDSVTDAFPLQNKKQLDPVQYVLMVSDVLNMGKNVCLARHFDTLKKPSIPKNTDIKFIDVWTMNVLKPFDMDGATTFDTNSLFMMQLATICNMVSVWKKLKIRIFVRVKSAEDILRLEELLKLFRIRATVHEIQNWSEISNGLINVNEERSDYDDTDDEQTSKSQLNMNYIKQLNQIIKEKSSNCTAVSFIYLPCPPNFKGNPPYENEFIRFNDNYLANQQQSDYFEATGITYNCFDRRQINLCHNYLKILTELTENLPPTVLVHGLNAVTSTTL